MQDSQVQYYVALSEDGVAVHIRDAEPHGLYSCAGCANRLVPRLGEQRAWHYAHRPEDGVDWCNPAKTVHNLARDAIVQAHKNAVAAGEDYWMRMSCDICGTFNAVNLSNYPSAHAEYGLSGKIADVAFVDDVLSPIVIEIVVTNPPDSDKRIAYARDGVEMHTLTLDRNDWDRAGEMKSFVHVDNDPDNCPECFGGETCVWCGWSDSDDHFDYTDEGIAYCANDSDYVGDSKKHCERLREREARNGVVVGFKRTKRGDKLRRAEEGVNALITPVFDCNGQLQFELTVYGSRRYGSRGGSRLVRKLVKTANDAANVYHENLTEILKRNALKMSAR